MRYMVCINNDEWMPEDEDCSFEAVKDAVEELLRSGYISVEYMDECKDDE